MIAALIVLAVIGVAVLAAWGSGHVRHPEQTAGHGKPPLDTTSQRFYQTADRPAGPDAEAPIETLEDQDPD